MVALTPGVSSKGGSIHQKHPAAKVAILSAGSSAWADIACGSIAGGAPVARSPASLGADSSRVAPSSPGDGDDLQPTTKAAMSVSATKRGTRSWGVLDIFTGKTSAMGGHKKSGLKTVSREILFRRAERRRGG